MAYGDIVVGSVSQPRILFPFAALMWHIIIKVEPATTGRSDDNENPMPKGAGWFGAEGQGRGSRREWEMGRKTYPRKDPSK